MQLLWDVTNACNQRCRHCYNSGFINRGQNPDAPWNAKACRALKRFIARNGVQVLTLVGGEPLLRPDIFQIADTLADDVAVAITTNGTLITGPIAEKIAKSPFTKVAVSLESARADTYNDNRGGDSFRRFRSGLELLCRARRDHAATVWLEFSVTIVPWCLRNQADVVEVYKLANETGCDGISFQFPISAGVDWQCFADSEYIVRMAETIAQVGRMYGDIKTSLHYKKCLVIHCNEVFGVRLEGAKTLCPAGEQIVYMDNQLRLFPCVYHNGDSRALKRIARALGLDGADCTNHLTEVGRLDDCALFRQFKELKLRIAGTRYPQCRGCALNTECYKICPYDFILNRRAATQNFDGVCRLVLPGREGRGDVF